MTIDGPRSFLRHRHNLYELLERPLVIGRCGSCDIVLRHASVSREHCTVLRDGPRLLARDLGSQNGILINGRAAETVAAIHHGDRLAIGAEQIAVIVGRRRPDGSSARGPADPWGEASSTRAAPAHELLLACVRAAVDERDVVGAELLGRSALSVLRRVVATSSDPAQLLSEASRLTAALAELTGDAQWHSAVSDLFARAGVPVPAHLTHGR